ncbi:hypothetical protein ABZZ44_11615 [Streptomyces sp. NPDC006460]|uniref:hypothetical protein n=1 Tax=Streptomyces sp. NPDC006460 TaxID=3154304 RepID=UPI0033AD7F75
MTLLDLLRWILLALAVLAAWLVIGVLVALVVWHPFARRHKRAGRGVPRPARRSGLPVDTALCHATAPGPGSGWKPGPGPGPGSGAEPGPGAEPGGDRRCELDAGHGGGHRHGTTRWGDDRDSDDRDDRDPTHRVGEG